MLGRRESHGDHYSDHITKRSSPSGRFEFDGPAFAHIVASARKQQGISTRELGRRADISQAYVVALERARAHDSTGGPTPGVDVVARLAYALGMDPVRLFRQTLRSAGQHVLLVVDSKGGQLLESISALIAPNVDTWVTAGRFTAADRNVPKGNSIRLRRQGSRPYDPAMVEASLQNEIGRIAPKVRGHSVGFAFNDMSSVLAKLDDSQPLLDFEHRWAQVVTDAARSVGARAAWNVCVYESSALQALEDPVAATEDLIRCHDAIWSMSGDAVSFGASSVRRMLKRSPTERSE